MKRQTNWIVGVSDGKVHEYKIGDVTYFVSAEFERSSQTNLRDRVQRTIGFVGLQKHINSGYAFAERQIAHNGKRGKGTRSPHGLKDYPT